MPVSVKGDPFSGQPVVRGDLALRTPQARVLSVLMPTYPTDPPSLWPLVTRVQLAVLAGVSPLSDSVWRALYGLRAGRKDAHPGLIARGLATVEVLDIEGVKENDYRITAAGVAAFQAYIETNGAVPPVKDRRVCLNDRYKI